MNRREFVKIALRLMAVWFVAETAIHFIYAIVQINLWQGVVAAKSDDRWLHGTALSLYVLPAAGAMLLWWAAPRLARRMAAEDRSPALRDEVTRHSPATVPHSLGFALKYLDDAAWQFLSTFLLIALGSFASLEAIDSLIRHMAIAISSPTFWDRLNEGESREALVELALALGLICGAGFIARGIIRMNFNHRLKRKMPGPVGFDVIQTAPPCPESDTTNAWSSAKMAKLRQPTDQIEDRL